MTTYILAGGNDLGNKRYGENLSTFVKRYKRNPTILSCFFARSEEDAAEAWPYWDSWFSEFFEDSTITRGKLDRFYEQVRRADVIYLHGGDNNNLIELFPEAKEFEKAVTDKIVIGSSAGANYLSSAYYRRKKDIVVKGSGIIPLPVLVHYGITEWHGDVFDPSYWQKAKEELQRVTGTDTVLCLPESAFVAFEK